MRKHLRDPFLWVIVAVIVAAAWLSYRFDQLILSVREGMPK